MTMKKLLTITIPVLAMAFAQAQTSLPFDVTEVTKFDEPWAMAFLPDGRILVTEKKGSLRLVGQDGQSFGSVCPFLAASVRDATSPNRVLVGHFNRMA